ncbi:MAG: hybrid sensor histidine kinase/response regulator [Deltaproteobacteria bacterium HGW-Deltaproteobacteria-14]|jgi:signal transduction histidine kinase|nr:MAG: hybrid sensor histidine kinase/response regulator [Deltaproteobacteria bacterium HGW-Deltaproteobacteria-14]
MNTDALLQLSRQLHEARTLDAVMTEVITAIKAATRYQHAWMSVFSTDHSRFTVVGNPSTNDERIHARIAALDVAADRFLTRCLSASEAFVIEDMRLDPDADQEQVAFFENRTAITVPMVRLAERLGAFGVGTFGDAEGVLPPTPDEFAFIVQVASLVSVIVGRLHAEEAHRALEERMRANQRLEALGRLAGGISHDFNNILVSIVGNSDLVASQLGGHPALELVEEVQDAAARAANLTRQLLAFSRGQLLDRHDLDLSKVIADLSRLLRRLLPDDVTLEFLPGARLGAVHADRGQLEQVVMNLAINARDAMPRGGRLVLETQNVLIDKAYVDAHPWAQVGRYVLLSVSDTGVGMGPEVCGQIFEPFFTTKPLFVGTGLGLAVVDSVVKQHQGFVHVYSEEGVGTTFKIYLPIVASHAADVGTKLEELVQARGGAEHVLVVDDDLHIRSYLERLLHGAGYRIGLAEGGAAALRYLADHPDVALVLTDLVMPVMSGPALIAAIADRPNPPQVLVMTGYARGSLAEAPIEHAITKPFGSQELLRRLREVLDAPA